MTCIPVNLTPGEIDLIVKALERLRSDIWITVTVPNELLDTLQDAKRRMLSAEKWVRQRNPELLKRR